MKFSEEHGRANGELKIRPPDRVAALGTSVYLAQ